MQTIKRTVIAFTVLAALVLSPAVADIFTVHLTNGATFETRYQPKMVEGDGNKVLFVTDVGNRIYVHRDDISEITHSSDVQGFGTMINTTTIALGWAPNDNPAARRSGSQISDARLSARPAEGSAGLLRGSVRIDRRCWDHRRPTGVGSGSRNAWRADQRDLAAAGCRSGARRGRWWWSGIGRSRSVGPQTRVSFWPQTGRMPSAVFSLRDSASLTTQASW